MQRKKSNNEIIRIAQVIGKLASAGVETVVNNYYRHMDHNKIQFDYYVDSDSDYTSSEEMEALGARYFIIPPTKKLFARIKALEKLFKENDYKIVHSHMNTLNMPVLYAAWKAHVPVRISHNHSMTNISEGKRYLAKQLLRPTGRWFATDYYACGEAAGKWFFGNRLFNSGKVHIIPNAIDVEKFQFNQNDRDQIRKEFGLEDKWVIGHVGRFMTQKNHVFLLYLLSLCLMKRSNAILLLVGDGELKQAIKKKAEDMNIQDSVLFLGKRNDVARIFSAMDIFVLPSLYEGVPVVGIEAQASGLPCIFSICVSAEVQTNKHTIFLPLDENIYDWVNATLDNKVSEEERKRIHKMILGSKYDLNISCRFLSDIYENAFEKHETIKS